MPFLHEGGYGHYMSVGSEGGDTSAQGNGRVGL